MKALQKLSVLFYFNNNVCFQGRFIVGRKVT